MNLRQQRFIDYYVKSGNASEAARKANYRGRSNTIGDRLLSNVAIASAIAVKMAELRARAEITEDLVTENFQACYSAAYTVKQYPAAIAANAELAKHIGYYAKDKQAQVQINQVVITEADRVKWLEEQRQRLDRAAAAMPAIAGEVASIIDE